MIKGRKKDRNGVDHASIKFQAYLLDKIYLCLVKKKKKIKQVKPKVIFQNFVLVYITLFFSLLYTHETALHF